MSFEFIKSETILKKAEETIPLGSQTFSKSKTQFPYGVSPFFIERGMGSRVWDVDGNEYVDFINGLLSVTLGYCNEKIDRSVQSQMKKGVTFSLAHSIESEVAEKIVELVPCAQKVRFGKNGSDATSAAIRLARAFTKKDHIAACGYHGWHDWYIGTTSKNLGVPLAVQELSHTFNYNDIESLKKLFDKYTDQIGAVILEPCSFEEPKDGFLNEVIEVAHRNGALVIFDEIISGFRFAKGGCQELFEVTPDLVALGKGMANGYPISAVAGREDVMRLMEEIFFSGTFGGETISLAAASVFLDEVRNGKFVEKLETTGLEVINQTKKILNESRVSDWIDLIGRPCWSMFQFKDKNGSSSFEVKTYFMQEAFQNGILTFGSHNISSAHDSSDLEKLFSFYRNFFPRLNRLVETDDLKNHIKGEVLKPLFSVRK